MECPRQGWEEWASTLEVPMPLGCTAKVKCCHSIFFQGPSPSLLQGAIFVEPLRCVWRTGRSIPGEKDTEIHRREGTEAFWKDPGPWVFWVE